MKTFVILLLTGTLLLTLGTVGCGWNNKAKGGTIGAAAGGAVGGMVGHAAGNTALGAIIGAAVGGTAGILIGNEMDKRAEEMRADLKGARVERVGEGIKITFDSGLLFDIDKADLQAPAKANVENLATILKKYPDTNILVEGDTDNTGSEEHNLKLSERRAGAVTNHLKGLGIPEARISMVGLGESNPIASNDTQAGRQQNRRVEVGIFANEKLKKAAQAQANAK